MPERRNWHSDHPPACTCAACVDKRLREFRSGGRREGIRTSTRHSRHGSSGRGKGKTWLVIILLLVTVGIGAFINAERLEELLTSYTSSSESAPRGMAAVPPTATPTHVVQQAIEAQLSSRTHSPTSTRLVPTATPILIPSSTVPTPLPPPHLRHLEEKSYMLELINLEREEVGAAPVILGENIAAQLHAETSLDNCVSSHWGVDGLKPYMRYSLAGGYQSNGENGLGSSYCITASDGYRAIASINEEIREGIVKWMESTDHRRNILDRGHKRVNIGIAWDQFNLFAVQHFEGDYIKYTLLPTIENGVLAMSGTVKNGVTFGVDSDLDVQIYFDPPPHLLTSGQTARTYCYDHGKRVASLRWPLSEGWHWREQRYTAVFESCPSPYDVTADALPPRSHADANELWRRMVAASSSPSSVTTSVPWITASEWSANDEHFMVKADLSDLLEKLGNGVYSFIVWGTIHSENVATSKSCPIISGVRPDICTIGPGPGKLVISQYSIFHGITPPDTYTPTETE